nr:hypothetical protein [uncultured Flavobacterium sp.]
MSTNRGKYFFIPDWLLQENSQTIHAYIFILNEINSNNGEFITTKIELAKTLNSSERQIATILTKMLDKNQINIRQMLKKGTAFSIDFVGVTSESKNTVIKRNSAKKETASFDFRTSLIEYGFQSNLVDDWLKVRKTKKATNTETAFKAFISEIETRECNINEMLKIAATNSWSGFKHIWVENLNKATQTTKQQEEKIGRTTIETIKKNSLYDGQY